MKLRVTCMFRFVAFPWTLRWLGHVSSSRCILIWSNLKDDITFSTSCVGIVAISIKAYFAIMYYAALGPYEKTAAFLSHFPYLALTIDASCDVISGPYLYRWHPADGKQDPVVCSLYILRMRESCCSGTASALCGRLYESRRSIIWSEINTDKFGIALSHRLSVRINPSSHLI